MGHGRCLPTIGLFALTIISHRADAQLLTTWTGTGQLTTQASNFVGVAQPGDTVAVELSYKSSTSPSFTSSEEAHYGSGVDVYIRFSINGLVWEGTQNINPAVRTAVVQDNANGAVDNLIFILQDGWSTASSNAQITGINANRLRLVFSGGINLFTGFALPNAQQVNLGQLIQFFGYIDKDSAHSSFNGNVSTAAVVPEPSTYALLLMTGAGALWWARRKRTN